MSKACKLTMSANAARRAPLVKNPQIQSATLHNPLPLFLHTYIWPFLAIWPAFFAVYLSEERYNTYIAGSEWTFVWAGSIVTLQSLTWLTTKWNVNIDSLFTSTTTKDVQSAKLIKVIPVTNAGSAEICRLIRDNVSALGSNDVDVRLMVCSGGWEAEYIFLIPEAPIPLQPSREYLCASFLRDRSGAEASDQGIPTVTWLDFQVRDFSDTAALWG